MLDRDRKDIQTLANLNLVAAPEFEAKSMEAIPEYVGDTAFIQRNIRNVLGLINVHEDSNDENQGPDMTSEISKMDILSDEALCKAIAEIVSEAAFDNEYKGDTQPMPAIADRLEAIEMILENACVLYGGDKEAARRDILRKHLLLNNRFLPFIRNSLCCSCMPLSGHSLRQQSVGPSELKDRVTKLPRALLRLYAFFLGTCARVFRRTHPVLPQRVVS